MGKNRSTIERILPNNRQFGPKNLVHAQKLLPKVRFRIFLPKRDPSIESSGRTQGENKRGRPQRRILTHSPNVVSASATQRNRMRRDSVNTFDMHKPSNTAPRARLHDGAFHRPSDHFSRGRFEAKCAACHTLTCAPNAPDVVTIPTPQGPRCCPQDVREVRIGPPPLS
jgi:hypothetical protein